MYNSFFGFEVDPFRLNPDPRFLYFSENHREALATLIYAMRERKGFVALTGEVGTGKTTVVNALLQNLESSVLTAYLFNSTLSLEDFFAYVFEDLGLARLEPFKKAVALLRLNEFLIERHQSGHQTILVIDEAQNLSSELLEEIRMLSNLETPQSKLLQIVFVGQPEFVSKLKHSNLRQLRQRIELWHDIQPLSAHETQEYVRERLMIAGHETGEVFTLPALKAIYRYTRGVPRLVNVLCDNALLSAFSQPSIRGSDQIVRASAADLGLERNEPAKSESANGQAGWIRRLLPRGKAATQSGL